MKRTSPGSSSAVQRVAAVNSGNSGPGRSISTTRDLSPKKVCTGAVRKCHCQVEKFNVANVNSGSQGKNLLHYLKIGSISKDRITYSTYLLFKKLLKYQIHVKKKKLRNFQMEHIFYISFCNLLHSTALNVPVEAYVRLCESVPVTC